jgi:sarcosine oxidase
MTAMAHRDITATQVAVIGGGIVGLSIAEQLLTQGYRVVCIEQGVPGASQSAGQTRIFRHVHNDPQMISLARQARSAWRDLEERLGAVLVGDEGVVLIGAADGVADQLEHAGVTIDRLDSVRVREVMPFGGKHIIADAIFDPDGGAIRTERAIIGLRERLGERLVCANVFGIASDGDVVRVHTSTGVVSCEYVIVAAGQKTAAFAASAGIRIDQRRLYHVRVAFAVCNGVRIPCLLDRTGMFGEHVYGAPFPDGRTFAIGLSGSDATLGAGPHGLLSASNDTAALERRIIGYTRQAFANVLGDPVATRICMSTPLISGDDDIRVWRKGRCIFVAGHNTFKFAPLLGMLAADAVASRPLPAFLLA